MNRAIVRCGLLITVLFLLSGLFVCTINDDNGNPAITGKINQTEIMRITIQPFSALKNKDTLSITVTVWKDTANPTKISNANVTVTVDKGWLSAGTITTDNNGQATVRFSDSLAAGNEEETRQITFTSGNARETAKITISTKTTTLQKRFLTISAFPYVINADGMSSSLVSLKVKDTNFNPIVGEDIVFSTSAGDVTGKGKTDASGIATAKLTSEKRNQIAVVTARLVKDTAQKITVKVEFSGIVLTSTVSAKSIVPNGVDPCTVTVVLQDAASNPIYGELVSFKVKQGSTAALAAFDSITDTRGQARCRVTGRGSVADTVFIEAAGARANAVINYSSNSIRIETSGTTFIANGIDSTLIAITYLSSDQVTPIPNATAKISITSGLIDTQFFNKVATTDASGQIRFYLKNPDFATTAIISVLITSGTTTTTASKSIYFRANIIAKIVLSGTPEVISAGGDRATLNAVAYDMKGNLVRGELIAFQLASGPGAGEKLDPPTAMTNESGIAVTQLISGNEMSQQQDVKVIAADFAGVQSNVVKFTIANKVAHVTITKQVADIIKNADGTYGHNCAALVTDINNNPVPDSTEVTFSLQITGYVIYNRVHASFDTASKKFTIIYEPVVLPFDDYNNNYIADPGEGTGGYPLRRGEDVVFSPGDTSFEPGPPFWDYNCNGRRDYDPSFNGYEPPEPSAWHNGILYILDYNGNGDLDTAEPLVDSTISDAKYKSMCKNWIEKYGYPDLDWNRNGIADPKTTAVIKKNVKTTGGKAANMVVYGQTDALRIRVKIWAECKGVVSPNPEEFILPITVNDYPYFRPLEGKKFITVKEGKK